jgi:hypothetical protein
MQTGKEIDENHAKCATEMLQRERRCQDTVIVCAKKKRKQPDKSD